MVSQHMYSFLCNLATLPLVSLSVHGNRYFDSSKWFQCGRKHYFTMTSFLFAPKYVYASSWNPTDYTVFSRMPHYEHYGLLKRVNILQIPYFLPELICRKTKHSFPLHPSVLSSCIINSWWVNVFLTHSDPSQIDIKSLLSATQIKSKEVTINLLNAIKCTETLQLQVCPKSAMTMHYCQPVELLDIFCDTAHNSKM